MREVLAGVDVIVTPTTPFVAPLIGQQQIVIDGREVPLRPLIGLYTQPIFFIGLPALSVPVPGTGTLPLGVQLIAAPWRESALLRVAAVLEAEGVVSAEVAW